MKKSNNMKMGQSVTNRLIVPQTLKISQMIQNNMENTNFPIS